MRKFRYSNFPIVTANVVELMADYVITASGNSNLLRLSVFVPWKPRWNHFDRSFCVRRCLGNDAFFLG